MLRSQQRVLQKFCVADLFSTKNQQMDFKPKNLYSLGYNILFDIIAIPSEAFFISIAGFVDACGIPCRVLLFICLVLQSLLLVLLSPALNRCTHQFAVDFVSTFCTPYTMYILIHCVIFNQFL